MPILFISMRCLMPAVLVLCLVCCSCEGWNAVPVGRRVEIDQWDDTEEQVIEEPEETYSYVEASGHYIAGFETSCFYPCGSEEMWWVVSGELYDKYNEVLPRQEKGRERVFARISGMVSSLGRYGHLGGGDRALKVMQVYEIRQSGDNDCE
jgi:hypothetical protein